MNHLLRIPNLVDAYTFWYFGTAHHLQQKQFCNIGPSSTETARRFSILLNRKSEEAKKPKKTVSANYLNVPPTSM